MTHTNSLNQDTLKQAVLKGEVITSNANSITYKINDTHSLIVPMYIAKDDNGNIEEHYITNEPALLDNGTEKTEIEIFYNLSMIFQIQADFKKREIEKQQYINQANALDLETAYVEIDNHSDGSEFNATLSYSLTDDDRLEIEVTGTQTTQDISEDEYETIITDYDIYKISVTNLNSEIVCELPLSQITLDIYDIMNKKFDLHLANVDYGTDQYHKWGYNFIA